MMTDAETTARLTRARDTRIMDESPKAPIPYVLQRAGRGRPIIASHSRHQPRGGTKDESRLTSVSGCGTTENVGKTGASGLPWLQPMTVVPADSCVLSCKDL